MKKIRLVLVVIVALVALAAAFGLKRVSPGEQAVRVGRDGSAAAAGAGWQFVGPGTKLVRYPVGERAWRVPETGTFPVLVQGGDSARVAFEVALTVPAGIAAELYRGFSDEFEPALRKLVVASAEIEAAALEDPADAEGLRAAVAARIEEEMGRFTVTTRDVSLVQFGERAFQPGQPAAAAPAARRLIILGVDGGDWLNLKPLMDAGRLPNFARLARDGATGPLRSEEPMLSPLLWTTMATGRLPEEHGILNFTVADPKTGARVPISRLYRKVDAFWNMLGDYDRRVAIIGWLASDPAEAVRGLMVTDKFGYLAYAPDDTARAEASSIHPRSRADELAALVVHAPDVRDEEVARFVHLPGGEMPRHRGDFNPKDPVNNLLHLYASTRTFRNIGLHVLEKDNPDVLAVYFEWMDAVSHLFMLHAKPRMPDIPENEYAMYKDAVEESYVLQDEILGEFMARVDERTVLMVISDHGFKSGESRLRNRPEIWAGNAAKWHRLDGIIGFYGAGVKQGATVEGATLLDVTPTILALMGLPRATDMPGKPLASVFEDEVVKSFSADTVATLDRDRGHRDEAATSGATEETMKKLEALGYLAPDNADALNNLGQRYQQTGEYQKAIVEYKKAIAMRPNYHSVYNNLAVCYGHLKMYPEAEEALRQCITLKPDDFYAMNNLAVMMIETGRLAEAEQFAARAVRTEPGYANGHVTLGTVFAMTRRYDEAEKQFREALRLDPQNKTAKENLERLAAARGQR